MKIIINIHNSDNSGILEVYTKKIKSFRLKVVHIDVVYDSSTCQPEALFILKILL